MGRGSVYCILQGTYLLASCSGKDWLAAFNSFNDLYKPFIWLILLSQQPRWLHSKRENFMHKSYDFFQAFTQRQTTQQKLDN